MTDDPPTLNDELACPDGEFAANPVLLARAEGVPWTDLISSVAAPPPSPEQLAQARGFVQFRHGLDGENDSQTVLRGARILLAGEGAPLREKVWGLPEDPADPASADFSDVARVLDRRAAVIHADPGRGRHTGGLP